MGGEREDVVEAKKKATKGGGTETVGKIRFHETKGEVHFHDDAAKLKCAVPSVHWYEMWGKLTTGEIDMLSHIDTDNATRLDVTIITRPDGKLDCALAVSPAKFTAEFQKVQKFTEGS